jgi:hypothetical protein
MAFAQLRFIRHLPDGLASALVPAPSTVGIGAQHRRFARTLARQNPSTQPKPCRTHQSAFADRVVVAASNKGLK